MHRFRQFLFLLALVVIGTTTAAWAQTGVVRGTVVDAGGGFLLGANFMFQFTSIGAASYVDGEFIIRAVPAGPQVLVASYIGYQRVEVPVDVVAGETVTVEIAMSWEGLVGDEVVITAQARGQTQAINERSEEHTSELQSRGHLVCRLLLEKIKLELRCYYTV